MQGWGRGWGSLPLSSSAGEGAGGEVGVESFPQEGNMQFLKDFLFNLAIYAAMLLVLYLIFPDWMLQMYALLYKLLGPFFVALVILSATVPWRRLRRR